MAEIFRLARQVNPKLKSVGVVWNPAEVNSEYCTKEARKISAELGITLLEAPVEQAKDVREAARSLVARGVEAFWTGGDATVNANVESLTDVAKAAKIPVFSNIAGHAKRGGLFDLGADYHEVGAEIGRIAAEILAGKSPADIPVKDFVPKRIILNEQRRAELGDAWLFSPELNSQAFSIIDINGVEHDKAAATTTLSPVLAKPDKQYKVGLAFFAPEPGVDSVMSGLREGLVKQGFVEGKNLAFMPMHAQGEIGQIPTMGQVLDNSDVDAILTLTTPVLQGVAMAAKHKPAVFTYVTDPLAAGAGKSYSDHLPNLTGIGSLLPVADMLSLSLKVLPKMKAVGTLYNPSEANSVKVVEIMRAECAKRGLTLEEVPISTTAEAVQGAQALAARHVDVFMSVGDNTMYQALDGISKIAKNADIPLVLDQPEFVDHDALMVIGIDYKESGNAAADLLAKVLTGVKPATLPFQNVSKRAILLNEASAKRLHVEFPSELIALAKATAPAQSTLNHTWKIKRLLYVESPPAEQALQGIDDGFKVAGLTAGKDFVINDASAQADMTILSGIADTINSDGTELVMTLSTPTLETVLHKVKKLPIVFTFVADPVVAGAGKSDTEHLPNVTGVYTLAPYKEMVALLKQYYPDFKKLGTLFTPGEDNSVYNKNVFVETAKQQGIDVVTLPVNSASELPNAALAIAAQPIDAWVQILDNQIVSGFTAITQAAARAKKPLLTFTESGVQQGAALAFTMDYYQAGFDAATKAAEVMRGKNPKDIAFSRPGKIRLIISEQHAQNLRLPIAADLLAKADKRL